jgi:hypothetical protein
MFDAPIPGQSLTQSPDTPLPYETPPEFTNVEEAQEWIFEHLTDPDSIPELIGFISDGVPIEILATQVVFGGMAVGKWNTDLMLLLIEPAVYTLLFIAEQSGVDYILSYDELDEVDSGVKTKVAKYVEESMGNIEKELQSGDIKDIMNKRGLNI